MNTSLSYLNNSEARKSSRPGIKVKNKSVTYCFAARLSEADFSFQIILCNSRPRRATGGRRITIGVTCSLILLFVLFNRRKRTLHDLLAGTVLVRTFPM